MEFKEAYETLVKRSVERNTKEIPAILSCLDFENTNCLEVGAGPLARIAIKLSGFAKHITCLEKDKDNIPLILGELSYTNLDKKVSALYYPKYNIEKFPFNDNHFDVTYCAWLPHKTTTDIKFLEEMCRVSKKHILILMPGIKGDEPKLISIVRPGEKKRRQQIKDSISRFLKSKGCRIDFKEGILKLEFADEKEIKENFYCMAFKNDVPGKKMAKVDAFLKSRVKNFADGFYIIHAVKS